MPADGRLSTGDFRSLVWSEIEGWKHAKRLRVTLMALSVFLVLVVGANVAMAVGVAGELKGRPCLHAHLPRRLCVLKL